MTASELNPRSQSAFLLLLFFTIFISSSASPTVYEILSKFGLPTGLLPDSVQSYSLSEDGLFSVELPRPCYVQFDYLVYYRRTITGHLTYGSITDLEGIEVKRVFLWFDVNEIRVDLPPSDSIYFQVGFINKKLDVHQFQTVHSCQDGYNSLLPCDQPGNRLFELPTPMDEIQGIITA